MARMAGLLVGRNPKTIGLHHAIEGTNVIPEALVDHEPGYLIHSKRKDAMNHPLLLVQK